MRAPLLFKKKEDCYFIKKGVEKILKIPVGKCYFLIKGGEEGNEEIWAGKLAVDTFQEQLSGACTH